MSRYGFDPSKFSRWPIAFPQPLRPKSVGAFDNPVNCFGINYTWMTMLVVASEILHDVRTWENPSQEQLWFMRQQVGLIQEKLMQYEGCEECPEPTPCPDCPDCPDCPENPPKPVTEPITGILGLTLQELESYVMGCLDISNSIRMSITGLIEVRTCDGWVTLSGQAAPIQTTAQSALAEGMSYSQWIALEQPVLPDLPAPAYDNPDYNTPDSIRCAKATTLANTLKHFLTGIRDELDDILNEDLDFAGVVTAVSGAYVIGSFPAAFAVASLIWAIKNTAPEAIEALNEDIDDAELWSSIVCDVSGLMSDGTTIRDDDIDWVVTNWQNRDTVGEPIKQIIYAHPMASWKNYGQQRVASTDCGCSQFLPSGVLPPLPTGAMRYDFAEFGYADGGFPYPADGAAYPAIYAGGRRGEPFGAVWGTELTDVSGGYSSGFMQAVFKFSSAVNISEVSMLFTFPDGAPSNDVQWANMLFTTDGVGEWKYGAGWGGINDAPEVRAIAGNVTGFAVAARGTNLGAFRRVVLAQLLVSGTFLGEPFINLPPGQVFQT